MKKLFEKVRESPINYFSDLFIVAMVILWIADIVYETIVATSVTIASVILSFQTGISYIDTSMWSSIGNNVAIPLAGGGAVWLVKCGVQHAIANKNNRQAHMDFPKVDGAEDMEVEEEEQINGL